MALAMVAALPQSWPGLVPLGMTTLGAAAVLLPGHADARSRSSGGYSRPGGFSRTPSFGTPSIGSRIPSTSGGYSRPAPGGVPSIGTGGIPGYGDRAISRQMSREALDRYRSGQGGGGVSGPTAPAPDYPYGASRRPSTSPSVGTGPFGWGGGWRPPPYIPRTRPSFGIWDAMFLWFLLDTLNEPGHAAFFHHHQDDPGYAEWRAEAEQQARTNPEIREKLGQLDAQLAQSSDEPRDPDYLPPGTTPDEAMAGRASPDSGGGVGGFLPVAALAGGGLVVFFGWLNLQQRRGRRFGPGGGGSMDNIKKMGEILRRSHSGETYKPAFFRVGMVLPVDPAPFVLAEASTKVKAPGGGGANDLVSVAAVTTLSDGPATLHRLYLPEERGFFQLHLDTAGYPDECRYFSRLDEIHPADEDEWSFWLDPREGMIGWPEFQTKDGKVYPRVWAPGSGKVPPRTQYESGSDAQGMILRTQRVMLYGLPTGAAAPGPPMEYILVAVVEQEKGAWVEIHAGIDVSPASLSLA